MCCGPAMDSAISLRLGAAVAATGNRLAAARAAPCHRFAEFFMLVSVQRRRDGATIRVRRLPRQSNVGDKGVTVACGSWMANIAGRICVRRLETELRPPAATLDVHAFATESDPAHQVDDQDDDENSADYAAADIHLDLLWFSHDVIEACELTARLRDGVHRRGAGGPYMWHSVRATR